MDCIADTSSSGKITVFPLILYYLEKHIITEALVTKNKTILARELCFHVENNLVSDNNLLHKKEQYQHVMVG